MYDSKRLSFFLVSRFNTVFDGGRRHHGALSENGWIRGNIYRSSQIFNQKTQTIKASITNLEVSNARILKRRTAILVDYKS